MQQHWWFSARQRRPNHARGRYRKGAANDLSFARGKVNRRWAVTRFLQSAMQVSVYCPKSRVKVPCLIAVKDTDKVFDILDRLRKLWGTVRATPAGSLNYYSLLEEIRALSDEHQALIEAFQKLEA
jgi:hypothetical protein